MNPEIKKLKQRQCGSALVLSLLALAVTGVATMSLMQFFSTSSKALQAEKAWADKRSLQTLLALVVPSEQRCVQMFVQGPFGQALTEVISGGPIPSGQTFTVTYPDNPSVEFIGMGARTGSLVHTGLRVGRATRLSSVGADSGWLLDIEVLFDSASSLVVPMYVAHVEGAIRSCVLTSYKRAKTVEDQICSEYSPDRPTYDPLEERCQ